MAAFFSHKNRNLNTQYGNIVYKLGTYYMEHN